MIDKKEAKRVYNYLNAQYNSWYFAKGRDKEKEEEHIRYYLNHSISGELYCALAEGHGSGLCAPGHFKNDLGRCFKVLEEILKQEDVK